MTMDLKPFTAKGFPGRFDEFIASVPVRGVDGEHTRSMVRLCPETAPELYEGRFSPRRIVYHAGSRPRLDAITGQFDRSSPSAAVHAVLGWVNAHVKHPHHAGWTRTDRGLSEEDIIASGVGWCNEQTRVFVALCEVIEMPARICFLFHANGSCSHTAAEVFIEGRWAFLDPTFNVSATLPNGRLASAFELSGPHRELAHEAYEPALRKYYERVLPFVENMPGWNAPARPEPARGGDLLETIGIANYLIEGVEAGGEG